MLKWFVVPLLAMAALAQTSTPTLPPADEIRIGEFYRLMPQIVDKMWPDWSTTPAPLLLVTQQTEFLTHHPRPPADFKEVATGIYARPEERCGSR